jgi:hypothetical protein
MHRVLTHGWRLHVAVNDDPAELAEWLAEHERATE